MTTHSFSRIEMKIIEDALEEWASADYDAVGTDTWIMVDGKKVSYTAGDVSALYMRLFGPEG